MPERIQLFVTCLVDLLFPSVGRAAVDLLEAGGWQVEVPAGSTCCGQPAYNVGANDSARRMADHTVGVLDATEGPIVVPSGSCAATLIHHVPDLVSPAVRPASRRVAERVRELTSFLAGGEPPEPTDGSPPTTVAYHHSCHGLRMLDPAPEGERLVEGHPGLRTVELAGATECCGFGGLFSVEMPEISAAIMGDKLDAVEASGAEVLTGGDVSCLMHLAGGLRRRDSQVRVCHVAELLVGSEPW